MIIEEGHLEGEFKGFENRYTVFEFRGGKKWHQMEPKYVYFYSYAPWARVINTGGRFIIEVEGMSDSVEVRQI